MPLYIGDYLRDTQHLSTEQHGAYLLLLITMWSNGGYLPNDPKKLCRIARVHPPRWKRVWEQLEELFEVNQGDITQGRLAKEYEKSRHNHGVKVHAGRIGGRARALKYNKPPQAYASRLLKEPEPEPYISKDICKQVLKKPDPETTKISDSERKTNLAKLDKLKRRIGAGGRERRK